MRADRLREIPACRCQLALRATELFQQQVGEAGVRCGYADSVLKALVMDKHRSIANFEVSKVLAAISSYA
jgi:hypothetical protein